MFNDTSAVPSMAVVRAPTQRAVSANLVRMVGWTIGASPPVPLLSACRSIAARSSASGRRHGHGHIGCHHARRGCFEPHSAHAPGETVRGTSAVPLNFAAHVCRRLLRFLGHRAAEDAQIAHRHRLRRNEVLEPSPQARFGLRIVLAPPFPEELLDLGHVAAAGNVLDRLVVDGDHRGADERLAAEVGQLDFHLGLFARLVRLLRRLDFDIEHPLFRLL